MYLSLIRKIRFPRLRCSFCSGYSSSKLSFAVRRCFFRRSAMSFASGGVFRPGEPGFSVAVFLRFLSSPALWQRVTRQSYSVKRAVAVIISPNQVGIREKGQVASRKCFRPGSIGLGLWSPYRLFRGKGKSFYAKRSARSVPFRSQSLWVFRPNESDRKSVG